MTEYRKHAARPVLDPVVDVVKLSAIRTNTRPINPDHVTFPFAARHSEGGNAASMA